MNNYQKFSECELHTQYMDHNHAVYYLTISEIATDEIRTHE